ncbi:MAG TPA: hypothetical protein PK668_20670 [Myxococcota bacterium]|nr:hypothetical protein [Myxococcota bacterium]HRY96245.1 hypothetical protein [Myxococcota bacterium]
MITIEKYADLCAAMAQTGGDVAKENAIASAAGVSPADWDAAKKHYTAKMSDPADMGKTALAFMPLYQAAQARARGGKEPCTLEFYTKVHAEMAFMKDPMGNKINFMLVLAQNGTNQPAWLECEGYWTPIVGAPEILGQPNPKYNPELSKKFAALMQKEADRIHGIKR